jgi:GNAT superfamily N-acetyltransferase
VATSSLYAVPCALRPEARLSVQLQFMAVEPAVQRRGIGSAVMAELIRWLEPTDASWDSTARVSAVPFYERSGFRVVEGSGSTPRQTGRPHHLIELSLRAQRR